MQTATLEAPAIDPGFDPFALDTDFMADLNPMQREAAEYRGSPLLIQAGAGSGKTRTLTCRMASLIKHDGIPSDSILLVTFTNKASKEMVKRVTALLGDESFLAMHLSAGTFHHVAHRLMREFGGYLGVEKNFTICEEADAHDIVGHIFKKHQLKATGNKDFTFGSPLSSIRSFLTRYSNWRNRTSDMTEVLKRIPHMEAELIRQIISEYESSKRESNQLDFDDLLYRWVQLTQHGDIGPILRNRWTHVLIDEYHDQNPLQELIVRGLNHSQLCVVGDPMQSIYRFRAAEVEHYKSFKNRYSNTKLIQLPVNYRSGRCILSLANSVTRDEPDHMTLIAGQDIADQVRIYEYGNVWHESQVVLRHLRNLLQISAPEQIAVLCRTVRGTYMLESLLDTNRIPFEKRGGLKSTERAEIRLLISYLRTLFNPKDEGAWLRVFGLYPKIGPSKARLAAKQALEDVNRDLKLTSSYPENVKPFIEWYNRLVSDDPSKFLSAKEAVEALDGHPSDMILESFRTKEEKASHNDAADTKRRGINIETQINDWRAFEELDQLFMHLVFEDAVKNSKSKVPSLIISTIHSAKGLEWDHVVLFGAGSHQMPHPNHQYDGEIKASLDEERRLTYVAVTRPRKDLIITYPREVEVEGALLEQTLTPFIPEDEAEKYRRNGEQVE